MNKFNNKIVKEVIYHYTGESEEELIVELIKLKHETKQCSAFVRRNPAMGKININSRFFGKSWISKIDSFYGWDIVIF